MKTIITAIQQFGFPLVVAIWALWRLDRNWAKGESVQLRLDEIDDALDRIELSLSKQAEITQEMLVTMRLYTQIMNSNIGGGNR
jgi:hypothetical protein